MSGTFYIKRNDTSPKLIYTLSPPVNLTAASVVFNMRDRNGGAVIARAAATVEDAAGVVGFAFTSTHTAVAGLFSAEFEITYADTTVETFPNQGYILIRISEDLG
jgi:hypothetical protein